MPISLGNVMAKYWPPKNSRLDPSRNTERPSRSGVIRGGVDIDQNERSHLREFLDWVHEKATTDGGSNPGRTANKARENLRAILPWAWEHDYVEKLPRFPKPKSQRDVAGRHDLTKADLNALYFAT